MAFRPGEATLKEDWVWKQNRLGRWQKRWLRLTDQRIIYWHNKPPGAIEAGATVDRYAEELAKILDDGEDVSSWGQSNDGKRRSEVAAQKKKRRGRCQSTYRARYSNNDLGQTHKGSDIFYSFCLVFGFCEEKIGRRRG